MRVYNEKVRFILDRKAGRTQILGGNMKMRTILDETANEMLSNIKGMFIVDFGFEPEFEIVKYITDRATVKIAAADAATAAVLKHNPGWLDNQMYTVSV